MRSVKRTTGHNGNLSQLDPAVLPKNPNRFHTLFIPMNFFTSNYDPNIAPWVMTEIQTQGSFNININNTAQLFCRRVLKMSFLPIFMYHVKLDPQFQLILTPWSKKKKKSNLTTTKKKRRKQIIIIFTIHVLENVCM